MAKAPKSATKVNPTPKPKAGKPMTKGAVLPSPVLKKKKSC